MKYGHKIWHFRAHSVFLHCYGHENGHFVPKVVGNDKTGTKTYVSVLVLCGALVRREPV